MSDSFIFFNNFFKNRIQNILKQDIRFFCQIFFGLTNQNYHLRKFKSKTLQKQAQSAKRNMECTLCTFSTHNTYNNKNYILNTGTWRFSYILMREFVIATMQCCIQFFILFLSTSAVFIDITPLNNIDCTCIAVRVHAAGY